MAGPGPARSPAPEYARHLTAADAPTFDLQSHSVHSDGALAPDAVVTAAAAAGVTLLALTDHDSTAGVAEARRAAQRQGIQLVPATEISALEGRQELHILGYLIDPEDPALASALAHSRGDREARARAVASALIRLGFAVDTEAIEARIGLGESVGRPHLAQAVIDHPVNRARLQAAGLLDPSAFLTEYLIEGRPAFVPRSAPTVERAIELIHGAGGVAVWAHPFWDVSKPSEVLALIDRFAALGLDGVEAFYATHTEAQARVLADRCAELGLLSTGSSDFHGPRHRIFSAFRAFDTYGLEARLGPVTG